jgi:hypothetical protein
MTQGFSGALVTCDGEELDGLNKESDLGCIRRRCHVEAGAVTKTHEAAIVGQVVERMTGRHRG